eukprot:1478762-Rhodomonas_salina.3
MVSSAAVSFALLAKVPAVRCPVLTSRVVLGIASMCWPYEFGGASGCVRVCVCVRVFSFNAAHARAIARLSATDMCACASSNQFCVGVCWMLLSCLSQAARRVCLIVMGDGWCGVG